MKNTYQQQADAIREKINQLEKEETELREMAKNVKSPERIFLDIIDGCTIKIDKDKYPDSIFLFKGDDWMFEIEKSIVWCRWDKVWNKIYKAISGDYNATQAFIKDLLEQHFKMNGVTPNFISFRQGNMLEQHFKIMNKQ